MSGTFFLRLKRKARAINRRYREARMVAAALKSPYRPILAQIIPVRRCNLSCAYCNEYDKTSEPVPVEEMARRIDRLPGLGGLAITLTGGGAPASPRIGNSGRAHSRRQHHRHVDHQRLPAHRRAHKAVEPGGTRLPSNQH